MPATGRYQLTCNQSTSAISPRYYLVRPRVSPKRDVNLRLRLELDVHAGAEVEVHQRVHRLGRRLQDSMRRLCRAHLEVLARLLVDVRRPVDAELVDLRREGHRTAHDRAPVPRHVTMRSAG